MAACSVGINLSEAWLAPNFCAEQLPITLGQPRSLRAIDDSSLICLERNTQTIQYLFDTNSDGLADSKRTVVTAPGINHGLALHEGYLYASSATTVYRWALAEDSALQVSNAMPEVVVAGMSGGGHSTRTLALDDSNRLYVSIGSLQNVDPNSDRSRIKRFSMNDPSKFPLNFDMDGELFADGLRNEVGLAFDRHGILWGVENGADRLTRGDLGGFITDDNPGEELNRFLEADIGKHWGYPWCWSEFYLPEPYGLGAGTVWAWPTTMAIVTDADCRANYMPSALSMQAHSAPLGIVFYNFKPVAATCKGTFPKSMDGHAFIAFHGSWNRRIPTGYKVVYVEIDETGNVPAGVTARDLLAHSGENARWPDDFRPVDVDFDDCGRLLVSSDGGGSGSKIVRISYSPPPQLCFLGEMTVEKPDGTKVALRRVQVGDMIKVDKDKYERIYAFGHQDSNITGEYLQLTLTNGQHLEISANHMVFRNNGQVVIASQLKAGESLHGSATIRFIRRVHGKGAFAPFTSSGVIVVNGVKASCYVSLQNDSSSFILGGFDTSLSHHTLAHFVLTPLRMLQSEFLWLLCKDRLLQTAQWLLTQNPALVAVTMLPLLGYCGLMYLVEMLFWIMPGLLLAFLGGFYCVKISRDTLKFPNM